MLGSAKHPNILPLLAAYTQGHRHSLVFPAVSGGNLARVLGDDRTLADDYYFGSAFSDEHIMMQLLGLCTAVSCMHNFKTETLSMIGCHRDLKPSNILVNGRDLLLADFGLAIVVGDRHSSSSRQPQNMGNYVAPECQSSFDATCHQQRVRRSSDIWSLGCILLRILILRVLGASWLKQFEMTRVQKIGKYKHRRFYQEKDSALIITPEVEAQLLALEMEAPNSILCRGFSSLIRGMLSLDPIARPLASAVSAHIQCMILSLESIKICHSLRALLEMHGTVQWYYAQRKIEAWSNVQELFDEAEAAWPIRNRMECGMEEFKLRLDAVKHLQGIVGRNDITKVLHLGDSPLVIQAINSLWAKLTSTEIAEAKSLLETSLLNLQSRELKSLELLARKYGDTNLARLARLKCNDGQEVESQRSFSESSSGKLPLLTWVTEGTLQLNSSEVPFISGSWGLAERMTGSSDRSWDDQIQYLQQLSNMFRNAEQVQGLDLLRLNNPPIFQDDTRQYCGLVYKMPKRATKCPVKYCTLQDLLSSRHDFRFTLEQKFRLAHSLAQTVHMLHAVGWIHGEIHDENVIYIFEDFRGPMLIDPEMFYLIGFSNSQLASAYNRIYTDNLSAMPRYWNFPRQDYDQTILPGIVDYYFLGLVLLEIALSESLKSMHLRQGSNKSLVSDSDFDVTSSLSELSYTVGDLFRGATEFCVHTLFSETQKNLLSVRDVEARFKSNVLDPLTKCKDFVT